MKLATGALLSFLVLQNPCRERSKPSYRRVAWKASFCAQTADRATSSDIAKQPLSEAGVVGASTSKEFFGGD